MSERLDTEELHGIMDRAFEHGPVQQHVRAEMPIFAECGCPGDEDRVAESDTDCACDRYSLMPHDVPVPITPSSTGPGGRFRRSKRCPRQESNLRLAV